MMADFLETERRRLLYRASYRGFKEADILIGSFAKEYLPKMMEEELSEFSALLELPDHDLYNYLIGKLDVPDDVDGPVFRQLAAFDVSELVMRGNR